MTEVCSYCGRKLNSREAVYMGVRDGIPYTLHPACRAEWVKVPK